MWPVLVTLFTTSGIYQVLSPSPVWVLLLAMSAAFLRPWVVLVASAFFPLRWSFLRCWSVSGPPECAFYLLWLYTGRDGLGSRSSSACRLFLLCGSLFVRTFCSRLSSRCGSKVSAGSGFMPGASPAFPQAIWFLYRCGCLGVSGQMAFVEDSLPFVVGHFSRLVSLFGFPLPVLHWLESRFSAVAPFLTRTPPVLLRGFSVQCYRRCSVFVFRACHPALSFAIPSLFQLGHF